MPKWLSTTDVYSVIFFSPLKVKFVMSDQTNLADLLALNLHKFEDEVRNIVDKATKELSMEKTLRVSSL